MCPQVSLSGSDGERQPIHHRELSTRFWPQLTAAIVYQHCLVSLVGLLCRWWRTLATDKVICGTDQQLPWPMRGTNNNDWGENQPSEPVRSGKECAGSSGSQELHPENKQGWVVSSALKGLTQHPQWGQRRGSESRMFPGIASFKVFFHWEISLANTSISVCWWEMREAYFVQDQGSNKNK